jgi:hypothetical protein
MQLKVLISKVAEEIGGKASEKNGVVLCEATIAERKAFLSTKKLTYSFRVRIDDESKTVKFSEMLKEAGSGFSSGGGFDDGMSTGFGFKKESYNTMSGGREGSIEEDSKLFGKTFQYKFDYAKTRQEIEAAAKEAGYSFEYQILPVK